jgi:hypothetical protein
LERRLLLAKPLWFTESAPVGCRSDEMRNPVQVFTPVARCDLVNRTLAQDFPPDANVVYINQRRWELAIDATLWDNQRSELERFHLRGVAGSNRQPDDTAALL